MFDEDVKRLLGYFTQIQEGKPVDLQEMTQEFLKFFEKLRGKLQEASEAERKEIFSLMNEMHRKLLSETKKISEKTGLSDEQLVKFVENPSNFSPEQWHLIQEARGKMKNAAEQLTDTLQHRPTEGKPDKSPSSRHKKPRGGGRSGWLRS